MTPESLPAIDDGILIRRIAPADAQAAAQLTAELGYPTEIEIIGERIQSLNSSKERIVYVACVSDTVIGWIDVAINFHLSSGTFGEIGGLVVSSEYRSRGVGRKLVAAAERWIAAQGVTGIVVRSRTTREAAHRFYLREGFSIAKTSVVFSKQLKR